MSLTAVKIPSENMAYKPGRNKAGRTFYYLNKPVREYKNLLALQIPDDIKKYTKANKDNIEYIESDYVFVVNKRRFNRCDITNMLKSTEDAVFAAIGLDDSLVRKNSITKELKENSDEEYLRVNIKFYNHAQQDLNLQPSAS